jgi:hypothetical protein
LELSRGIIAATDGGDVLSTNFSNHEAHSSSFVDVTRCTSASVPTPVYEVGSVVRLSALAALEEGRRGGIL